MNSSITFNDKGLFLLAVTQLELEATPAYSVDHDNMSIYVDRDEAYRIAKILQANNIFNFSAPNGSNSYHDQFRTDAEVDADALVGTEYAEDYGLFIARENE